jgi:uncharacterized SAM-binding protein YcdF (DUF218 family)
VARGLGPEPLIRVFPLGKAAWEVLEPGNLLLIVLAAGTVLMLASRGRRGRVPIALATLGFLVLSVAPIGRAMLLPLEQRFPKPAALPQRIDGILVLGGMIDPLLSRDFGEPVYNRAVARMLAGVALARQHPEAKLALVGGEGTVIPVGYPEARGMLRLALAEGIDRTRILIEARSRSTHENAVLAKSAIRPAPGETWVLVTSAWHMPRAVAAFRAVGWPVIPYPVDFRVDPKLGFGLGFNLLDGLELTTLAGKEWLGLLAYRLFGWTRTLFPAPGEERPSG